MPRNVRNWWLEGRIDGRTSEISGGPQAKDGGFVLEVYQRDNGSVTKAGTLSALADRYGRLSLAWINAADGSLVELNETQR